MENIANSRSSWLLDKFSLKHYNRKFIENSMENIHPEIKV